MTRTRSFTAARESGLLWFIGLFVVSFAATCSWLKSGEGSTPAISAAVPGSSQAAAPDRAPIIRAMHAEPDIPEHGADPLTPAPKLLPAADLAVLVATGISADDSEQRSLAILELAQAPIEQSLGGLGRILRENRDTRSRITALEALMRLPDSALVRAERQRLLDVLSGDPDANLAEAVRSAAMRSNGQDNTSAS